MFIGTVFAGDTGNTFKSVTVGFEVTKPKSWQFVTVEQNLENLKRTKLNDEEFHKLMLKYATAPLVAMMKYPEPFDDLNPSFKVNIKPLGQLKETDPKQILTMLSAQFGNIFKDYEVVQSPIDTRISGIKSGYMRINYSLQIPDGRMFPTTSELWIVPKGDYFFMMGAGTRQDEKTGSRKEIQKILKTIRIDLTLAPGAKVESEFFTAVKNIVKTAAAITLQDPDLLPNAPAATSEPKFLQDEDYWNCEIEWGTTTETGTATAP